MPEHTVVPARVRLLALLMAVALAAVSYAIWTSPLARRTAGQLLTDPLPGHGLSRQAIAPQELRPEPASRARRGATAADTAAVARLRAQVAALRARLGQAGDGAAGTAAEPAGRQQVHRDGPARVAPPAGRDIPRSPRKKCWDFRWQQDAQAAYLADLSDPLGLDGPPGPGNDDGIACAELPVDPRRPASVPVGARVVKKPATPTLAALRKPTRHFFGIYTEQSPYSWSEVDKVVRAVGKVPSMAGYFGAGDEPFRPDAVLSAWTRGMLPLLTWELRPKADMGPGGAGNQRPGYSLAEIAGGSLDPYLRTYAHAVTALGLPLAIRLDHEMNGSWYPWSIYSAVNGRDGKTGAEWYRLMWRHVHDIFVQAGATNVLWVWSPNVTTFARSDFRNFYPGDGYVDWIGLSGYYRRSTRAPDFETTYGPTLRKLRDAALFPHAAKPILLSEIGATENGGNKVIWINNLFTAFKQPANADLIGFCWFHNTVTSSPEDPTATTNDWRITSSKPAATAFATGIADPAYAGGH
jgi:mannan endo-1,4-beta-mannosidase